MQQQIQVTEPIPKTKTRLQFIDFTRGLVMMIMAWDHISGFWMEIHGGLEGILGARNLSLDLVHTLTRFISHYCAPTFVFLSGVSLAFSVKGRLSRGESQKSITLHIIKRGLILLVFEALFISPAFELPSLYFGVIAAIGVSLIVMSIGRRLPQIVIFGASLYTILNQQWINLGFIPDDPVWGHYLRRIIAEPGFTRPPYFALYPITPWIGVLGLGWVFGTFLNNYDKSKLSELKLPLTGVGLASIGMSIVIRYMNGYGNLVARWSNNILDWLYISKYPPSIVFLLWALGGMCLFFVVGIILQEKNLSSKNITGAIHTFGRVPLFFYITHLWLYRFRLPGVALPFHLTMTQALSAWLVGLIVLWKLCVHYEKLKLRHPRFLQYI
jgi:uncharacterized membrane protein